jgi:hypothetical protein
MTLDMIRAESIEAARLIDADKTGIDVRVASQLLYFGNARHAELHDMSVLSNRFK